LFGGGFGGFGGRMEVFFPEHNPMNAGIV